MSEEPEWFSRFVKEKDNNLIELEKEVESLERADQECSLTHRKYQAKFTKEISELRELVQDHFHIINKNGIYIWSLSRAITSLKEDFKIKRESDRAQINANLDAGKEALEGWRNHEVVLRELLEDQLNYYYFDNPEQTKKYKKLLKKLSGDGNKLECNHESHFIDTLTKCEKCEDDRETEKPSEQDNALRILRKTQEMHRKNFPKEKEPNYCSNCGRLNDMCGVFLRKINLCDSCIDVIFEIVVEKIPVSREDLEWLLSAPNYGNIENEKRFYALQKKYSEVRKKDV